MKKLLKNLKQKLTILCGSITSTLILAQSRVYAASGTESIGGVMFALGWQREDAEGKSRGLMTLMAGFMLVAIAQSKSLFGL